MSEYISVTWFSFTEWSLWNTVFISFPWWNKSFIYKLAKFKTVMFNHSIRRRRRAKLLSLYLREDILLSRAGHSHFGTARHFIAVNCWFLFFISSLLIHLFAYAFLLFLVAQLLLHYVRSEKHIGMRLLPSESHFEQCPMFGGIEWTLCCSFMVYFWLFLHPQHFSQDLLYILNNFLSTV